MQEDKNKSVRQDTVPGQQSRKGEPRYPKGCPIDGHQGFGCTCNPLPGH